MALDSNARTSHAHAALPWADSERAAQTVQLAQRPKGRARRLAVATCAFCALVGSAVVASAPIGAANHADSTSVTLQATARSVGLGNGTNNTTIYGAVIDCDAAEAPVDDVCRAHERGEATVVNGFHWDGDCAGFPGDHELHGWTIKRYRERHALASTERYVMVGSPYAKMKLTITDRACTPKGV